MKKPLYCLLLLILSVVSCKRWKYDEVKIHGQVINGCLGKPMAGEQVSLVEVKGEFLGAGTGTTLKTVTTNNNGEYDFGGVDLRKKEKYTYYVNYVHRGITLDGYCDSYEVDKNAIDLNQNLVVFVVGGLQFQINPDLSVINSSDSIIISVSNSVDYSRFYCNPDASQNYRNRLSDTIRKAQFFSDGLSKLANPIGNAYYYVGIKKIKSGITSVSKDTIYVNGPVIYNINW